VDRFADREFPDAVGQLSAEVKVDLAVADFQVGYVVLPA
jgi:hypothetical protein